MIRTSFNDGWQVRPKVNPFAELSGPAVPFAPVTLPHDAMIGRTRSTAEDGAGAYFPGGAVEYRKSFPVPEQDRGKRIVLEFEGVYRDAVVFLNGAYAGQRPYGYSRFLIDADRFLKFGEDNEVRVEARTHKDSRWYTGAGIYRDTWMLVGGVVRIAPDGVAVSTPDVDAERAVVEVAVTVVNDSIEIATHDLAIELRDPDGAVVADGATPVTVLPGESTTARLRLYVPGPRLWNVDNPALYRAEATLGALDRETVTFGIRSLRLDPVHGLRINGETVKLRGACIHHDNGIIGAVSAPAAERRRVRLLKEAGFNAIRMSHHPAGPALLDACDALGMLMIDESFDVWTSGKSEFDYHLNFADWWERDVEAMVVKDRNHPSVIMYSIGNEISETGTPAGAALGRKLAEKVRSLDPTRYVTNGINNMLAVMADLAVLRQQRQERQEEGGGINTAMANAGDMMNAIAASELVTGKTAQSYALLDVAGMNYSESRYALDKTLFPNRIILGTETFPTRIDGNWALVREHDHVIGDFTWTGWDYLGEVGIGRPQYLGADERPEFTAPYPYLLAGCGDIDITGHRRPASYYRQIVFGLRSQPYLAVRRPEHHDRTVTGTPWVWSDAIASWTWPGFEDKPVTVEVYADADEVELLINGHSAGRRALDRFRTEFEVTYQPGDLVAIAYRDGQETGRDLVRTATGPIRLYAQPEQPSVAAGSGDLAYVTLTLADNDGAVHTGADRTVTVTIEGDGELLGFGGANPATAEKFHQTTHTTYEGRALAVVRPTGPGEIRLVATAPGCEAADVLIPVEKAAQP
ncbi:glycoside hydrolase family 2 TIM barrel-domain containing protein [Actinoplanes sp. NPDC051851]|uniref:glycoside hydrolase family 2 TIM barrel-domain containing protein n=1 Tax=Actinoplanes sp. NPDC051851 TaxID=3154753 RepID=UPI0034208DF7